MGKLRQGQRAGSCDKCHVLMWQLSEIKANGLRVTRLAAGVNTGAITYNCEQLTKRHTRMHVRTHRRRINDMHTLRKAKKRDHINEFH